MKKFLILVMILCFNLSLASYAEIVIYNPNSKIYHAEWCRHAARCKVCIKIEKAKAKARGGRPCKVCGG